MTWPSSSAGAKMSNQRAVLMPLERVKSRMPSAPPAIAPGMPMPPFQICGMAAGLAL